MLAMTRQVSRRAMQRGRMTPRRAGLSPKRAEIARLVTVIDPVSREEVRRPLYEVGTSHMARRTFIGNLYNKVKDPNLISSMSGHVNGSRAFARYRAIDDDMKRELVNLIS